MKKIAPTLCLAVESPFFMPGTKDKLRAELRALLAVARAARPFAEEPTHPVGETLRRALARLDKVSK